MGEICPTLPTTSEMARCRPMRLVSWQWVESRKNRALSQPCCVVPQHAVLCNSVLEWLHVDAYFCVQLLRRIHSFQRVPQIVHSWAYQLSLSTCSLLLVSFWS